MITTITRKVDSPVPAPKCTTPEQHYTAERTMLDPAGRQSVNQSCYAGGNGFSSWDGDYTRM